MRSTSFKIENGAAKVMMIAGHTCVIVVSLPVCVGYVQVVEMGW